MSEDSNFLHFCHCQLFFLLKLVRNNPGDSTFVTENVPMCGDGNFRNLLQISLFQAFNVETNVIGSFYHNEIISPAFVNHLNDHCTMCE